MDIIIISLAGFLISILTFFSGFGLGTLLLPVFVIFFPLEISIALTAIVHFLNNLFKLILLKKHINFHIGLKFGIPAIIAALIGAQLLIYFGHFESFFSYSLSNKEFSINLINIIIGILLIFFALVELIPAWNKIHFSKDKLILGGLLSGFFGGLSGHQGALRSAFLVNLNLAKESFIATGVLIACFIDIARLSVYFTNFSQINLQQNISLLLAATLSAFAGALVGNLLLKKVTINHLKLIVGILLLVLGISIIFGIL